MDAVQSLALKRIKSNNRDQVVPGEYDVDFLLHVHGYVRVGEDVEYTPTAELPQLGILALAMRYCGVTREALAKAIKQIARQAKETGKSFREVVESENEWASEILADIKASITYDLPKKTRKGPVTGRVVAEVITPKRDTVLTETAPNVMETV